jgi:membrane protease YdiL (CAAX protease family)
VGARVLDSSRLSVGATTAPGAGAAAASADPTARRLVLGLTWGVSLLAVGVVEALADLAGLTAPGWLTVLAVALVVSMLLSSVAWRPLRPFRAYWLVVLIMLPAIHSDLWPSAVRGWQIGLAGAPPALGGELVRELAVAVVLAAALFALGRGHRASYLAIGQWAAPARPVRLLIDAPISWARLGPLSGVLIAIGTLAFVLIAGVVPDVDRVVSVLPTVLAVAGLNALNEEVVFRAGPLATLRDAIGDRQTLLLVATLFAVPHYFGVPYGLVGVAMAWVFAWWVAKSMLETRGIFWAWAIHLLQDIVIFSFILTGALG